MTLTVVIDQPAGSIFSEQNALIDRGATAAVDELDAQRGGSLRITLVSRRLDGLSAAAVRTRLQSLHAAALILPCDTNSEYQLAADVAHLPIVALAPCDPDPSAGLRYPNYWAVGMGANAEAAALGQYITREGFKYVYVVKAEGAPHSVGLLTNYYLKSAAAQGNDVVGSATISISRPNYSALARAIEDAKHKAAIFTALPPPYVNQLVAGLAARGVHQAVFGTAAMDTPLSLKSDPPNGTYYTSYGFLRDNAAAQAFTTDYSSLFHTHVVGSFPGLGLETIRLLEAAAAAAHSDQPSAMNDALENGLTLTGVGLADRSYARDGDHNPLTEVGVDLIEYGTIVPEVAETPAAVIAPF